MNKAIFDELSNRVDNLEKLVNGGKGSGNWGHLGRPGQLGGSASRDDKSLRTSYETEQKLIERGIIKTFGEKKAQKTFEQYKAEILKKRAENKKRRREEEKLAKEMKKRTEQARKARAKKYSDPNIRRAIEETGDLPEDYQKKHKRAWNE